MTRESATTHLSVMKYESVMAQDSMMTHDSERVGVLQSACDEGSSCGDETLSLGHAVVPNESSYNV